MRTSFCQHDAISISLGRASLRLRRFLLLAALEGSTSQNSQQLCLLLQGKATTRNGAADVVIGPLIAEYVAILVYEGDKRL